MGIYDELSQLERAAPSAPRVKRNNASIRGNSDAAEPTHPSTVRSITESTARSTEQPIDQSTGDPMAPPASQNSADARQPQAVRQRPTGFYLTQNQTDTLDDVVKRISQSPRVRQQVEARRVHRPDRSAIMRLILDEIDLSDDGLIDRLVDRLVD